jgi:thymidylate synthase
MVKNVAHVGHEVLEIEDYTYRLPAYVRFTSFVARKFNLNYVKKEFLWYLRGDRYDLSIREHAKMWANLVDDDGGINSNYGQYVFADKAGIKFVVDELTADKDSRRATIMILANQHLKVGARDVPCTYSLNFRIRKNKLKMSVRMRSQDAIFGMTNDAPCFSFIQECVFNLVKEQYPELELGTYTHTADSFHVYDRHYDMLNAILNSTPDEFEYVECPRIKNGDEVRFLMAGQFDNVPEDFLFTKWLLDNEG